MLFAQFGWNWQILSMYHCYFVIISPLGMALNLIVNLLYRRILDTFCWNCNSSPAKEDFLKFSAMYFHYFVIICPGKKADHFNLTNLCPPYLRMFCAKFGWNWPSGSGEEDFLILSMYFHYFVIISPWKRTGPFIWTNLNPCHPRMLCAKLGWNWLSG